LSKIAKVAVAVVVIGIAGSWIAGSILMSPSKRTIEKPANLIAEDVELTSASGDSIRGWWIQGRPEWPSIILVHGIRADRLAMLGRANLYTKRGYSIFLFDLPAHGQSSGSYISFGNRESMAVTAALEWVKARRKGGRVGVDGLSLGGAGVLLRKQHVGFDAIVVEEVFPDIHRAILNRLTDRFGALGYVLEPLLEVQLVLRLHEWPSDLAPVREIGKVGAPILVIGGEKDHLTPVAETQEIYANASEPKKLWIVSGAGHADFLLTQPVDFERIVCGFFDTYMKK
jgi:pimeloyl-ACP methyl ester carboxylesterase